MASYKEILRGLLDGTEELTPENVKALSEVATKLAAIDAPAPAPAPKPEPIDPVVAARERFAAIEAAPLPAGTSQRARLERAHERAKLLTTITGMAPEDENGNSTQLFHRGSGPEAA